MRFLSVALGGLLLSTALPALAQTAPPTAAPRYYVGLSAYSSFYQKLGRSYGTTGFPVPVQLTAGYQITPRLAVQVGVAYSGFSNSYFGISRSYSAASPNGAYIQFNGSSTARHTSVSVLARYTLTRNPAHRFQVDALGGFGLERGYYRNHGTQADSLSGHLESMAFDYTQAQNNLLLTAGLGARYRLSRHFELTYDFTVNKTLSGYGYERGLTNSQALGLRYRFGR